MAEARAIVSDIDADFSFDGQASRAEEAEGKDEAVSSIAQAILAAERRGTERERDRCAKIADDDSAHCRKRGAEVERSAYEGTWLCCADTGELIASAIREGAS